MNNQTLYTPKIKQDLSDLFLPFFATENSKENLLDSESIRKGIEDLLKKVSFSGPSFFFIAELPDIKFYYFSDNVEEIIGSTPKDILASNGNLFFQSFDGDFDLMNQIVSKGFEAFQKVSSESRKESTLNLYYNAKNIKTGKSFSVVQQNFPLSFDENGFLKGYAAVVTDISFYSKLIKPKVTIVNTKTGELLNEIITDIIKERKLSKRELDVLKLIAKGVSNEQISERLCISYHTVRTHRKNILKKTKISSIEDVITYYKSLLE